MKHKSGLYRHSCISCSYILSHSCSALVEYPDGVPEPKEVAGGQELYFEVLELQPIRLSLSFMRTERVNAEEK